jgi:hypothetical protein
VKSFRDPIGLLSNGELALEFSVVRAIPPSELNKDRSSVTPRHSELVEKRERKAKRVIGSIFSQRGSVILMIPAPVGLVIETREGEEPNGTAKRQECMCPVRLHSVR